MVKLIKPPPTNHHVWMVAIRVKCFSLHVKCVLSWDILWQNEFKRCWSNFWLTLLSKRKFQASTIVLLYRFFNDDQEEVYQYDETIKYIYFKPYCRIPPYVMGIVLGYVLYQHFSKDFKLSWVRYVIQE